MSVQLEYVVTQHIRDRELLEGLEGYLGCGKFAQRKGRDAGDYKVLSIKAINDIIIPFFVKYPLQGIKSLNFADFSLVAEIMVSKGHLTSSGFGDIERIKAGMNKGRSN